MARVLSVSSQTVFGPVGNSVVVPALQSQGHEVLALPTVVLSHHPGHGRPTVQPIGADFLISSVNDIERLGVLSGVDAVLTGYFASAEQVQMTAQAIARIVSANPVAMILVDPVIGDHGRLYVKDEIARAIREQLLPLATIITPNHFELDWLTGGQSKNSADVFAAAAALGVQEVVVTSVSQKDGLISTVGIAGDVTLAHHMRRENDVPNGTGDLLAGLYLAHRLKTPIHTAFTATMKQIERAIVASIGKRELQFAAALFAK